MTKNTVNLILLKEDEPPVIKKLKIILPITAAFVFIIFIFIYIASIVYINNNVVAFNLLKRNVDQLEKNITSKKNIEGIYTMTSTRLNILDQLSGKIVDFPPLINDISNLNGKGIFIKTVSSDSKGNVSFTLRASSSASLDDFVSLLENLELEKIFSQIKASGIVREKKGIYNLSVSLKKDLSIKNEQKN